MYLITIKNDKRKGSYETISGEFWLAYHSLNTLYGIEEKTLDEAFKATNNEQEFTLIHESKTFIIKQVVFPPERSKQELEAIIGILETVIRTAGENALVSLAYSFTVRVKSVLTHIHKSI